VKAPKPDPDIYLTAMARLGVKPAECLVVEDNEHGVRAALASGAHLLKVDSANDVHYQRLMDRVRELEEGVARG
jgi:beta-phosphoglucomutase-like phosphatase (HAD superfamily)